MPEELASEYLKDRLLKAAARKREEVTKLVRARLLERGIGNKSTQQVKQD